ncbi:hypothetical protein [Streptomyces sp. NPDC095613]|uniref:hypothetical protein n=1 Tax=Streptomyces sp. NPDC095613 TaxID=3155540 RepID=UPI0033187FE6
MPAASTPDDDTAKADRQTGTAGQADQQPTGTGNVQNNAPDTGVDTAEAKNAAADDQVTEPTTDTFDPADDRRDRSRPGP